MSENNGVETKFIQEPRPEPKWQKPVRIEKPEGIYTIIYGVHFMPQDPKEIPQDIGGLVLEGKNEAIKDILLFKRRNIQYESLVPTIENRRIPVYSLDFSPKTLEVLNIPAVRWGELLLLAAENAIGLALLGELLKRPISRRDFLKKGVKALGSAWFLSPILSFAASGVAGKTNIAKTEALNLERTVQKIHPEIFLFGKAVREVLIAHKEQWLMEQLGNRPHLATIIGAGHLGIEDKISHSPEERLTFLRTLKPLLKAISGEDDKYDFYAIQQLKFKDPESWYIENFEVPELKELVT